MISSGESIRRGGRRPAGGGVLIHPGNRIYIIVTSVKRMLRAPPRLGRSGVGVVGRGGVEAAPAGEAVEVPPHSVPVSLGSPGRVEFGGSGDGLSDGPVNGFGYVISADGALGHLWLRFSESRRWNPGSAFRGPPIPCRAGRTSVSCRSRSWGVRRTRRTWGP